MQNGKKPSLNLNHLRTCLCNNSIILCERALAKKLSFAKKNSFASVPNQPKGPSLGSVSGINFSS